MPRQSLYIVQFPTSAPVCQVDDFPRGTARSVDGALHVRPGGTKKITKTELEHLKKIKPWGRLIREIKKVVPGAPQSQAEAKKRAEAREQADKLKADKAKEQAETAAKTSQKGGTKKDPKKVADKGGKPTK